MPVVRKTIAPVDFRPGNRDLHAELHPAENAFTAQANLDAVLQGMQLPPAVDGSVPIKADQIAEIARQVYDMDSEGRAIESASVGLAGNDWPALKHLLDRWNAELARRVSEAWDTDFGPHVAYAFGYDMGGYLQEKPLWGEGKTGPYADGAGGFVDSRMADYTTNRRKGRPIEIDRPLDLSAQPPPDWTLLM